MIRTIRNLCIAICALALAFLSVNVSYAGQGCKDLTGVSGTFEEMIDTPDGPRSYMLYVPARYKNNRPTPLVFDFHGLGANAGMESLYTQMKVLAEKYKFILVTPNGIMNNPANPALGNSWNGGACCGTAMTIGIDDVGFVSDLIDKIMENYCIHPNRIFATGFSNGGFLSHRLACQLSDRIAAIATVAATNGTYPCEPERPVPIISFNGDADSYGFYHPGVVSIEAWAYRNGCSDETELYYQEGDVTCVAYKDCEDNAEVVFCTIEGGGHTWPGAENICELFPQIPENMCDFLGYTTQDIDASRAIWKFFAEHSMPGDED